MADSRTSIAIHPVLTWASPRVQDLVFYVERDMSLPTNAVFEYGQAYPDVERYPHHRLVYVAPMAEGKAVSRWYYAADRAYQDLYNYEFRKADLGGQGGTNFDEVTRTYILPRDTNGVVEMDVDAEVRRDEPELRRERGVFTLKYPAMASEMPLVPEEIFAEEFRGYVLVARQQRRMDESLDSLYVTEVRVYRKLTPLRSMRYDEVTGKALPSTTVFVHKDEMVPGRSPAITYGQLALDREDEFFKLQPDGTVRDLEAKSSEWFEMQTTLFEREKEYSSIDLDSTGKYPTLTTVKWYYPGQVPAGATQSIDVLAKTPKDPYWEVQPDGMARQVRQVADGRYEVVTAPVVSGTRLEDGTILMEAYTTSDTWAFPAVLDRIEVRQWKYRAKEGYWRTVVPVFRRDAYQGPCKADVRISWSKFPQVSAGPDPSLGATPLTYKCPFFEVNLSACLHPEVTFRADTGTEDPTFDVNAGSGVTFPATVNQDWVGVVAKDVQKPYRGGYMRERVYIYPPFERSISSQG